MSAPVSSALTAEVSRPIVSLPAEVRITTAEIDVSCRNPVMWLFIKGAAWLVLGLFLAVISSIKLHAPGFLSSSAWLTLGRIRPAAMNAILYGFAPQTALGVLLWMMCRLGRTRLLFQGTICIAVVFWNLGVAAGLLGILAGDSTGFTWLEMPSYAAPILFGAYTLIGICAMSAFYQRRERSLYVSQWYLLAALFWFPWIYSAANLLLIYFPVRGVVQSIVNAWFTNNFLGLWLGPIGLAVVFYFLPKLSGRPLYSQSLAAFGFWTLAILANWTGPAQLVGGPVPAWIVSAGIVGNGLLIIPLICVALNWHLTLKGFYSRAKLDVTLRFIVFGAVSYLAATLMSILLSLRTVSAVTHLTYVEAAQVQLAVFGFVAMTLFGSLHYIVPRVTQITWPSAKLVQVHFWCSAVGIAFIVVALILGGLIQAFGINDPAKPFINVVRSTVPFIGIATLGQLILLAGQLALIRNLSLIMRRHLEPARRSLVALAMSAASGKEVRP